MTIALIVLGVVLLVLGAGYLFLAYAMYGTDATVRGWQDRKRPPDRIA